MSAALEPTLPSSEPKYHHAPTRSATRAVQSFSASDPVTDKSGQMIHPSSISNLFIGVEYERVVCSSVLYFYRRFLIDIENVK